MKTILLAVVLALAVGFTVSVHATTPAPVESVTVSQNYTALNVPAADLQSKIADAQAKCPSGKTVGSLNVFLNPTTGLYVVSASYR